MNFKQSDTDILAVTRLEYSLSPTGFRKYVIRLENHLGRQLLMSERVDLSTFLEEYSWKFIPAMTTADETIVFVINVYINTFDSEWVIT